MDDENIVLFESSDGEITLPVELRQETVWLTQAQMVKLFTRSQPVIARHIKNAIEEGEIEPKSNMQILHIASSDRPVTFYSLDVIISVGYRVKSKRGVEFRRWATSILRQYILKGHVENEKRLKQLGTVAKIIERLPEDLGSREILDIVESYTDVFKLLDEYDREQIPTPNGIKGVFALDYQECIFLIAQMKGKIGSALFGQEKDDSFRSSISVINQSYEGQELYPTVQEKAANLLYLIIKNHSFLDGNKRIG